MSEFVNHIEANITARELFRRGQRVLVGVSGGLDSMVLLDALVRAGRWKLSVAHFNHQLRGAKSDGDERLVRRVAAKLKLPFASGCGDVRKLARDDGLSMEMAARKLRHEFFAATARKLKISTIALAHHADDQVELFFLRLFRGAGGEGLAGMQWSNPSPVASSIQLVRPMLDLSKEEIRAYAKQKGVAYREDESNDLLDIQRNRIRHELIPLLTAHYQPSLRRCILRVMDVIGPEAQFTAGMAREWLVDAKPSFSGLALAVQRRVVQQQLIGQKLPADYELVERLRLNPCQWMDVSAAGSVMREADGSIRWRKKESFEFNARRQELCLSARRGQITFCGLKICWQIADEIKAGKASGGAVECFDAAKVGQEICLRCWQPGDRFQPIGTGSAKKLQDLFTNLKVPRTERMRRVVATTRDGELFWVEGLRMAEKFKLDKTTARTLKWSWQRQLRNEPANDTLIRGSKKHGRSK